MSYFKEFDDKGRYIEDSCYGCDCIDCSLCPRNIEQFNY